MFRHCRKGLILLYVPLSSSGHQTVLPGFWLTWMLLLLMSYQCSCENKMQMVGPSNVVYIEKMRGPSTEP